MLIQISQRNKSNGRRKSWYFCIQSDWQQFDFKKQTNVLRFCRYLETDKKGKPLKTYDVVSKQKDCSWKTAEPSDRIKQKALDTFMKSWTVVVEKNFK